MQYTTLGRTGLKVSVMGLGTGGPSRIGCNTGREEDESIAVVRTALDLGINFFDTAEHYGTESLLARGLDGVARDSYVLSTKKLLYDHRDSEKKLIRPAQLIEGVEGCLRRLRTDTIDIFHLHAVQPDHYAYATAELVPALLKLRDAGKIRFLGVTEFFNFDPTHAMLLRAVEDDCWDVFMIGFNVLNQTARERLLVRTRERDIGTLAMFAVRKALSRAERLVEVIADLKARGKIDPDAVDDADPLGFLVREGGARSLTDASYRFCRHEPGIDVVLSGTGNPEHLRTNAESITAPPLPESDAARLREIFSRVDDITGS